MNEDRFKNLWRRCRIDSRVADPGSAFAALVRHYGEPWRRYHTAEHLEACLMHFDSARDHMEEPDTVEIALWYHDSIYDIRGGDNEERSAELFLETVKGAVEPGFCSQVRDLIMVTQHMDPPEQGDARYIVDIDLSSFGQEWDAFMADSRKVRAELTHLSDAEFNSSQLKFLRKLRDRRHFYSSEYFRTRYEGRARQNLDRLLILLEGDQGLN